MRPANESPRRIAFSGALGPELVHDLRADDIPDTHALRPVRELGGGLEESHADAKPLKIRQHHARAANK